VLITNNFFLKATCLCHSLVELLRILRSAHLAGMQARPKSYSAELAGAQIG
jgi:hypothetical protein